MKYKLYGDGVHSDLPAIQEMLDSGMSLVYLPVPEKNYLIDGTIFINSNQELRLDRYTVIRLADNSSARFFFGIVVLLEIIYEELWFLITISVDYFQFSIDKRSVL